MEIVNPDPNRFTIYSKSGCPNCDKIKKILEKKYEIIVVNCDEYLLNKTLFLEHMAMLVGNPIKAFPIVFHNGKVVGGYVETNKYLDELESDLEFNEDF